MTLKICSLEVFPLMLGHKNLAWVALVLFHVAKTSISVDAYPKVGNNLGHYCMIRCLVLMRLTIWNFIRIVGNLGEIFF